MLPDSCERKSVIAIAQSVCSNCASHASGVGQEVAGRAFLLHGGEHFQRIQMLIIDKIPLSDADGKTAHWSAGSFRPDWWKGADHSLNP